MPKPKKADKPKKEKCRVCKRVVQVMCFRHTGYCSQLCEREDKKKEMTDSCL